MIPDPNQPEALLHINDALERLAAEEPRLARIVECRFFGGLSLEETAEALNTSAATVSRDWTFARAWLHSELAAPRPSGGRGSTSP